MRVITGKAKGRKLKAPKGMTTRPTSDRVKEALFSVISFQISNARFLDLFAGSGGMGIEALSRGAREVVFIEENPKVIEIINDNLIVTGLNQNAKVFRNDVYRGMERLNKKEPFDIIFLDPPYLQGHEVRCLEFIYRLKLLTPTGTVVVESSKRDELPSHVGNLEMSRTECYGDTRLSYYFLESRTSPSTA